MSPFLLLSLISLTYAAAGFHPSDHLDMFALLGDRVTLPCNIPSIKSCSSINWTVAGEFGTFTEVVKAGRVTAPNVPRLGLLRDCSLEINRLILDDARLYSCHSGALNSSVLLQILEHGIEEVITAAGESVSLSCSNTSSLGMQWAVGGRTLTDDVSLGKGQTDVFHVNKDSSLTISKVSALQAGDYQCSEPTGQQKVLNKIRLHTLHVTSEFGPGEDNLTLTCTLTCAKECEKDFNLTWSGSSQNSQQGGLMSVNNTLVNRLFLPMTSDELTCFVYREGDVIASKKWCSVNTLQTYAWVAIPLSLLICIAAGGLYACMKKKHKKDTGYEQSSIGMKHVYEVIQDANNEELHQPKRQTKREAATTADSFYDLLQAVN